MTGFQEPNLTNISRPVPDWSCKRWESPKHDWLSCAQCQSAYQAHIEAEKRGEPGVLHWFREDIQEATACGSRSEATTEHINGANIPETLDIGGKLYIDPRVTCPLCRDIARSEGVLEEAAYSDRPDPQTREAFLDWEKENSDAD